MTGSLLRSQQRARVGRQGDLWNTVRQFLTSLGLEPDVRSDAVDFLFRSHLHRVELDDIDSRLERCQVADDEAAMLTAGLLVGSSAKGVPRRVAMPPGGLPSSGRTRP
jgi:hypothetical protein